MSIINEALKKTAQYIQEDEVKKNPLPDKKDGPRLFLLYILILLAGIFLSNFIFRLLGDKIKTTQPPKKAVIAIQQPAILPPLDEESILPEEEKALETTFVLSGIFFSDNHGYALVNNQIVRKNDLVDGAKVAGITANTVELESAGKLISLSLSTRR